MMRLSRYAAAISVVSTATPTSRQQQQQLPAVHRSSTRTSATATSSVFASSRVLLSSSVPATTSTEVASEETAGDDNADDHDWREPNLQDLDRSIPQVDCEFVSKLIKSRTARLVKHRKQQGSIFEKVLRHKEAQAGHRRKNDEGQPETIPVSQQQQSGTTTNAAPATAADDGSTATSLTTTTAATTMANASNSPSAALLKKALDADGDELVEQGVLTEEEWDVFAHSRPEYDDGYLLIDCRTVNEITSWGIIEGAKVLPAHEMYDAFKLTPEEFDEEFGFAKPHPSQKIIFYCQFGARSLMAGQILSYLGYPNVLVLREGYHEWAKQYNLLLRRWTEHDRQSGNDLERRALFEAAKQLQREIAPEFNELPLMESERLLIDETRSKGTLLVGDGLRQLCMDEVDKISSGIDPSDLTLPPSLNDQVREKLLDSPLFTSEDAIAKRKRSEGAGVGGASRATTGDYNHESSPQGMFNFMLKTTGMETEGVSSESRSPSARVGLGGEQPSIADTNRREVDADSDQEMFRTAYNDFSKDPSYIGGDTEDFLERDAATRRRKMAAEEQAKNSKK